MKAVGLSTLLDVLIIHFTAGLQLTCLEELKSTTSLEKVPNTHALDGQLNWCGARKFLTDQKL